MTYKPDTALDIRTEYAKIALDRTINGATAANDAALEDVAGRAFWLGDRQGFPAYPKPDPAPALLLDVPELLAAWQLGQDHARQGIEETLRQLDQQGHEIREIWTGEWSSDDGLLETRPIVGQSSEGFHYADEESERGGDPGEPNWSHALPTEQEAIWQANDKGRRRAWPGIKRAMDARSSIEGMLGQIEPIEALADPRASAKP